MKNLTEKAILVNIQISQWTARKYDSKVTAEVNKKHKTTDAGRFNKLLIATNHLKEIQQIANSARTFHYRETLPWSDQGERLLSSLNYFEYTGQLSEYKNNFESAVRRFVNEYPDMIDEAKKNLNGLFRKEDYPVNIAERFGLKSTFMPVPEQDDIRINVSDKELNELKEKCGAEIKDRFASAQRDIYQRVIDQLQYMREPLSNEKGIFRDSLFQNILDLVNLLPRLNVAEDPKINAMCEELKAIYTDPENVRQDKKLRKEKVKEVDAMLSKIDSFINF